MIKSNKILKISGITAALVVVLILLSFVGNIRSTAMCDDVLIEIKDNSDVELISEMDLKHQINTTFGVLIGVPLNQIDTKIIENSIVEMPQVSDATVYKTIDKKLIVELTQRTPIVRLIDANGKSALLGTCGTLIPIPDANPARLPVLSGAFEIEQNDQSLLLPDSIHQLLYRYAVAIASDKFWQAQIQHTTFNLDGDFVAYPQVGKHQIIFGSAEEIELKLAKLRIFYQEGISEANWNKYARINLKYRDQIVCTKK